MSRVVFALLVLTACHRGPAENDPSRPLRYRQCLRAERLEREQEAKFTTALSTHRPTTLADAAATFGTPSDVCRKVTTGHLPNLESVWLTTWSPRLLVPLDDARSIAAPGEPGVGYALTVWTESCASDARVTNVRVGEGAAIAFACDQYIYDKN